VDGKVGVGGGGGGGVVNGEKGVTVLNQNPPLGKHKKTEKKKKK